MIPNDNLGWNQACKPNHDGARYIFTPFLPSTGTCSKSWPSIVKHILAISLLFVALLCPLHSQAGVYGDSLGKCMVNGTSHQDKQKLVEWLFAVMALHPSIGPYVNFSAERRERIDKGMAALVTRLIGTTCKAEAVDALKYEGASSFEVAFNILGQVASQQIFAATEVAKGVDGYLRFMDMNSLEKKLGFAPSKP
jgi:hypothetical protein